MIRRVPILFGLLLVALVARDAAAATCSRVLAMGDVHGGYDALVTMLTRTGFVDDELKVRESDTCFVQTGDLVDRGDRSREVLDLLIDLEAQAPDRVTALLGNHEVMNMVGDLRYLNEGEISAFAGEESAELRDEVFAIYRRRHEDPELTEEQARRNFDERFPPGWFARQRAFSPGGKYGDWLVQRPIVAQIDKTVFVHGGLRVEDAQAGVRQLNKQAADALNRFFELRGRLNDAGWLDPMISFQDSFTIVHARYEKEISEPGGPTDGSLPGHARDYLELARELIFQADGPLWNRDLALGDPEVMLPELTTILAHLGAQRVVMSHTVQDNHRINLRLGGGVLLIDTGAGPAYGGHPSTLEILRSGRVSAIYPDSRVVMIEPKVSEAEIETHLREGRIVEIKDIGVGITKPRRAVLEYNGERLRAAFKDVDVEQRQKLTRFEGGIEMGFSDKYANERAAYVIDRVIGMNMVPVAVFREVDGKDGAMVLWIEHAITEEMRRDDQVKIDDMPGMLRQRDIMRIFDVLIANDDRNLGNQLITLDDGKLHLIDHTRAFRLGGQLPRGFEAQVVSLPRWLYDGMLKLDQKDLKSRLKGVLSSAQIKAMLARRDRLIRMIDAQREVHGDAVTFHPDS